MGIYFVGKMFLRSGIHLNSWFQVALGVGILICVGISAILVVRMVLSKQDRTQKQRATILLLFLLFQIPLLPIELLMWIVPVFAPIYLVLLISMTRTRVNT